MYDQTMHPMSSAASNALMSLQNRGATNSANTSGAAAASTAGNVAQNLFENPAIQPSSVINLSNSSDVVIGPMTQYQGPVTIYQYMDATVEARSMQANGGGITHNRHTASATSVQTLSTSSKILFAFILIVLIIIGFIAYLELRHNNKNETKREILFGNNYDTGTFPNLGNGHLVVDREQWGTSEQTKNLTYPLSHPIPYVMITHVGVQSTPCYNIYKCSIKMRTLQDSSIAEKGLPDISSNFYVGNDGNIYVGRGWDYANTYANHSLSVTFMGDYIRHIPDERQLDAVKYLLAYGITNKHLAIDYKLVAQNQTKSTRSPGLNVYKEIIKWPHWYPCGMDGNPRCGVELGMSGTWNGTM
ncbi:peptidoglycan-recognition protein LA isoform X1 [Eupeodes corollae]|uniref:peptidoglycan-recognition protein LA isoform X1 n=1 Tax=Eupeodes corollae TaxID=290404 RepID=UPI0024914F42|nr:peptidoglycan-recognition protein LA isoform X1 [Eupeodes corollae]